MKRIFSALAVASTLAILAVATPAKAETFVAARVGNYISEQTSLTPVPLDGEGDTDLKFLTSDSDTLVTIIYNAECGVLGPSPSRVTVEVKIDGKPTQPASGSSFAFCTATSVTAYSWVGATRAAYFMVTDRGSHKMQVLAAGIRGATRWWLGDSFASVTY